MRYQEDQYNYDVWEAENDTKFRGAGDAEWPASCAAKSNTSNRFPGVERTVACCGSGFRESMLVVLFCMACAPLALLPYMLAVPVFTAAVIMLCVSKAAGNVLQRG